MRNGWMVRAGRGGRLFQQFSDGGFVAVGWNLLAPLDQYQDKAEIKAAYVRNYGNDKPSKTGNSVAIIDKFVNIKTGDYVVTYEPKTRNYLVGEDLGQYLFLDTNVDDYRNIRKVNWLGTVKRDCLSDDAQRSLTSVLTLFSLRPEVLKEFTSQLT
ncbi:restriction endonuclease [Aliikangiella coralliicola]|uniref:Restriction endonuclease n=1 Tax=Aliikangiella coralliicola TaxID=2592383 RepID=A0A545UDS1_9GAMM|nr:hypothetical protein [Aliikangiella coralliicola]TQV87599.1 hypothetical protein FLL46_12065 [Aliikangiella coralliicola]